MERRMNTKRGYSWTVGWMQVEGIHGQEGGCKERVFMERRVDARRGYSWRRG